MKTINIDVFDTRLIYTASPFCSGEVFAKGFEQNGYDVFRFDYRASKNPNEELLIHADAINPDIFFFGKAETITPTTVGDLRLKYPNTTFIKFAADVRSMPSKHDTDILKYIDLFVATYAGDWLKVHKDYMSKDAKAMSIMTFTDSSFYHKYDVPEFWKSDVLWTGREGFGDNKMRNEIIANLQKMKIKEDHKIAIHGLNNWLGSPQYQQAICGTKIGIGSNSFNRRKYSSDRMGNFMACGTFFMTQYIDGIEDCFTKGENIEWFENINEMEELIEFYLKNEEKRQEIAKKGQEFILKYFDAKPLVKNILEVLKTGKSNYKWDEIV